MLVAFTTGTFLYLIDCLKSLDLDCEGDGPRGRVLIRTERALRWQRLPEMEKLGDTLVDHFDGIAGYCDHPVRFGVVESLNAPSKAFCVGHAGCAMKPCFC